MREFDIRRVREDFPILATEVWGRPLVYLDNAATAQKPRRVLDAMDDMYTRRNGNVHRGIHFLSEESTAAYEAAREAVRSFIGAGSKEEVIFTSGATASLNIAAHSLCELLVNEGDNVIVSEMEHHSDIVPWQLACKGRIRVLPFNDRGELEIEKLEGLIDGRTRIIAVTQGSNVLGTRPDIAAITKIAHRHGVIVVVDGCQGAVHGGINVQETGCDFYAFSGHKLYGPTGTGVLYGRRELLERMPPFMGGGDMVASVSFAETRYAALPFKFEAGTANYVGAVGMAEAIRYLGEFDALAIERHEQSLLEAATAGLLNIDGLRIYGTAADKAPIVSFTVEGVQPLDLGAILDKLGIAVRTGHHCAQPIVDHYSVPYMCRASFAMYNTEEEVAALVSGVERAVKMLRKT